MFITITISKKVFDNVNTIKKNCNFNFPDLFFLSFSTEVLKKKS